jgi:hypothetical protein
MRARQCRLRSPARRAAEPQIQRLGSDVLNDLSPHGAVPVRAVAFQETYHRSLADSPTRHALQAVLPILVREPRLAPDKGLVYFNLAAEFGETASLHREPDTVEHEPSGLLSDAERPTDLVGADPVFGIGDEPDRRKPLVKPERRILEDRPDFGRKLPLGMFSLALPQAAGRDEPDVLGLAGRAGDAVRPADFDHECQAGVRVGEVADGFLARLGGGWCLAHGRILPLSAY